MHISAVLVVKEHHNVNYPIKKVSLRDVLQLPSYISNNNFSSSYYCRINLTGYFVNKIHIILIHVATVDI